MKKVAFLSILVVSLVAGKVNSLHGQDISMEETLNYINQKFGQVCQVDVLRGVLVGRYYEGAELIREDQVLCKSLNISSMKYDPVNRLFSIDCNGASKCVDRQLLVRKIQRDYNRISFPVVLDKKGEEGMKNAFAHMIRLVLEPKYSSSTPFE